VQHDDDSYIRIDDNRLASSPCLPTENGQPGLASTGSSSQ